MLHKIHLFIIMFFTKKQFKIRYSGDATKIIIIYGKSSYIKTSKIFSLIISKNKNKINYLNYDK